MQKGLKRQWSFFGLATMVRITLMYYVDFYSRFNNPEKEWEIILSEASGPPHIPSLFDWEGLKYWKEGSNAETQRSSHTLLGFFEFYRTAIIKYLFFCNSKLLNINDITKRIGGFLKLPIQLFQNLSYPELALKIKNHVQSAMRRLGWCSGLCRQSMRVRLYPHMWNPFDSLYYQLSSLRSVVFPHKAVSGQTPCSQELGCGFRLIYWLRFIRPWFRIRRQRPKGSASLFFARTLTPADFSAGYAHSLKRR